MSKPTERVLEVLKERGCRRTPQRERIVEILATSSRPLTASEIHRRVRQEFPHVSLDTVYRNLELLCEMSLASRINLQNRETARFELQRGGEHHHHIICVNCGKTVCVPFCPVGEDAAARAVKDGFKIVGHAFELYGYCSECRPNRSS